MDCPNCGAANPESATFCSLCLNRFAAASTTPDVAPCVAPYVAPVGEDQASYSDISPGFWESASPVSAAPVAPSQSEYAPVDVSSQADAFLNAMGADRYPMPDVAEPAKSAPRKSSFASLTSWSNSPWRYAVWPVLFLTGVTVWMLSGGLASVESGKAASIPVPVQARLLGTVEELTEGAMGPLSADRRQSYATRVFAVPTDSTSALAYYSTGAGANGLAAAGWVGPTLEKGLFGGEHHEWTRNVALGYRAREEQLLAMWFGGTEIVDDIEGAAVPVGSSVVRIICKGAGVEKLNYPEK